MRFISYKNNEKRGTGILTDDGALKGLSEGEANYPGTLDYLVQNELDLKFVYKILQLSPKIDPSSVTTLPPLIASQKIICVGLNYLDHAVEARHKKMDTPSFFIRFASSLVGHDQAIIRPRASSSLDYEGEMVAVIGKGGRHISKKKALDHIVGYSIFNDASIREYQFLTTQWTMGKNFDATGAFGPALVTADEVNPGGAGLKIETRLNGQTVQSSNTDLLIYDLPSLIETLSEVMTLSPGDIIVTGTPAGVGFARDPKLYMKPGDICEVEIESLGVLRNSIQDEAIT